MLNAIYTARKPDFKCETDAPSLNSAVMVKLFLATQSYENFKSNSLHSIQFLPFSFMAWWFIIKRIKSKSIDPALIKRKKHCIDSK